MLRQRVKDIGFAQHPPATVRAAYPELTLKKVMCDRKLPKVSY